MGLQTVEIFVVEGVDGSVLDCAVHPLGLAVGPRVIGLRETVLDTMFAADPVERVAAHPGCRARPVLRQIGEGDAIVRQDGMELVREDRDDRAQEGGTDLAAKAVIFIRRLRELRRIEWVVYAKPPYGGPEQVLAYLGRYTHRVAIANSRLVGVTNHEVAFRWKDDRHHGKSKIMTLDAHEFIRRFLLHTLPDGFHRIRHYGILANGHWAAKLALCRKLLEVPPQNPEIGRAHV